MSPIVFPAGFSIDFRDINLEEMEFYARAWNLQRIQMQKGSFVGSMIAAHTPRIQMMRTPHSHGVMLQGDFPKDVILIAWVVTQSEVTFQNAVGLENEMKILKSGDEIDFLCTGESETFTLAVEEAFFYKKYESYFGKDFYAHRKEKSIYIEPKLLAYFVQGIQKWLTYLLQDHAVLKLQNMYETIEEEILTHVFSCIYLDKKEKKRQKFDVSRARKLLHESIEQNCRIIDIAQSCNISERLLFHTFKKNYGFSPKNYLNALRLNSVKEDLLKAESENNTINSIIGKYHFYNQSTFIQSYKQMFGELPSQTFKNC